MRILRHSAVQRLFSVGLLLSLVCWLAAPATGAARYALAAQVPPPVAAAFEQALAETASHGTRAPEAFVAAFSDALTAQSDPELAHYLDAHAGTDALLAVLYGQWMRAFSYHNGLEAAPTPPVASPAGASSCPSVQLGRTDAGPFGRPITPLQPVPDRPFVPLAVYSAAQPLGP